MTNTATELQRDMTDSAPIRPYQAVLTACLAAVAAASASITATGREAQRARRKLRDQVWLAYEPELTAAMKLLPPEPEYIPSAEEIARYERENPPANCACGCEGDIECCRYARRWGR